MSFWQSQPQFGFRGFRISEVALVVTMHLALVILMWQQTVVPHLPDPVVPDVKVFLYQPKPIAPVTKRQARQEENQALESEEKPPQAKVEPERQSSPDNASQSQAEPEPEPAPDTSIETLADIESEPSPPVEPIATGEFKESVEPSELTEATESNDDSEPLSSSNAVLMSADEMRDLARKRVYQRQYEQWLQEEADAYVNQESRPSGLSMMHPPPGNAIKPSKGKYIPGFQPGQGPGSSLFEVISEDVDRQLVVDENGNCFQLNKGNPLDATSSGIMSWSFSSACGKVDPFNGQLKKSLNKFLSKPIK